MVTDQSEFFPNFDKPLYTVIIQNPEQYKLGDLIGQVNAQDKDITNSLIYAIVGYGKERLILSKKPFYLFFFTFISIKDLLLIQMDKFYC